MENKKGSVKARIALGMTLVVIGIGAIIFLEINTIGEVISHEPGKIDNSLVGWISVIGAVFFFVFNVMRKKLKHIKESKHHKNYA
jgi:hypothetical protein